MSVEKLSNALDTIVNAMAEKYPLGTDFERYNDEIRTIVSWASDYLETLEQAGDRAKALEALDRVCSYIENITDDEMEDINTIRQALLSPEPVAKAPVWQPIDPDMPADQLRLHMGELTADEVRVARAAIRWANSAIPAAPDSDGGV